MHFEGTSSVPLGAGGGKIEGILGGTVVDLRNPNPVKRGGGWQERLSFTPARVPARTQRRDERLTSGVRKKKPRS